MICRKTLLMWMFATWIAVPVANAQYFGRNKVQYEKFDFRTMHTDHFDIYYYPEEEAATQLAARMAERWYARLSTLPRHELRGRQPLVLYAAHPHFQQTNALPGDVGEGSRARTRVGPCVPVRHGNRARCAGQGDRPRSPHASVVVHRGDG
jgi:hypothetical protein